MKTSKLYDLIGALSMSEKRYFKVYSNKHVIGKGNNYIRLFDLLERQKEYNDDAVKKASYVKNAAAEKNYLYNLILKALNSFHANLNSRVKVYQLLHSAEIIFRKGLYKQCEKILEKARKIAEESEHIDLLLSIGAMEEDLYAKSLDYDTALEKLAINRKCVENLENIYDLQEVATKTYQERLKIGGPRKKEHLKNLEKLVFDPIITNEKFAITPKAKLYQLAVKSTYYRAINDFKKDVQFSEEVINHYESHPYLIEHTPIGYVTSLYNLCLTLQSKKRYKDTFRVIEKLESMVDDQRITQSPVAVARVFFFSFNLKIFIFLKLNHFDKVNAVYEQDRGLIAKHETFITKPILYDLYFMLGKMFLESKNYKKALFYTNVILNDTQFKVREDLMSVIRLFNLILHFEKGNSFTLDYLATSTYQYFKRKDRLFKVETLVTKFLQGYNKLYARGEKRQAWEKLKEGLDSIKSDPYEIKAFSFFDFSKWADAKLNDKELNEVFERQEMT